MHGGPPLVRRMRPLKSCSPIRASPGEECWAGTASPLGFSRAAVSFSNCPLLCPVVLRSSCAEERTDILVGGEFTEACVDTASPRIAVTTHVVAGNRLLGIRFRIFRVTNHWLGVLCKRTILVQTYIVWRGSAGFGRSTRKKSQNPLNLQQTGTLSVLTVRAKWKMDATGAVTGRCLKRSSALCRPHLHLLCPRHVLRRLCM